MPWPLNIYDDVVQDLGIDPMKAPKIKPVTIPRRERRKIIKRANEVVADA